MIHSLRRQTLELQVASEEVALRLQPRLADLNRARARKAVSPAMTHGEDMMTSLYAQRQREAQDSKKWRRPGPEASTVLQQVMNQRPAVLAGLRLGRSLNHEQIETGEEAAEKEPSVVAGSAVVQRFTGRGKIAKQDRSFVVVDEDQQVTSFAATNYQWLDDGLVGLDIDYTLGEGGLAEATLPGSAAEHVRGLTEDFPSRAADVESDEDAVGLAAAGHIAEASATPGVRAHMGHVAGGAFTSKRDQRGRIKATGERLENLLGNIDLFYAIADDLKEKYQSPLEASGRTLTLYRAVATTAVGDQFTDILPSSTSFSLEFVKGWTATRGKENYTIFEITVPITARMLIMAYPDFYAGLRYPSAVNQAQQEVTLAPSVLTVTSNSVVDGFNIVKAQAQELGRQQAKQAIRESSATRGEDISDEDMAFSFARFKEFYSLPRLEQSYSSEFEDIDLSKLQPVETDGPVSKLLTVTHQERPGELSIELRYDQPAQKIEILVTSSGDEGPDTTLFSYDKRTIGDIFYVLRNLSLQSSESFEYLPLPPSWRPEEPESASGDEL